MLNETANGMFGIVRTLKIYYGENGSGRVVRLCFSRKRKRCILEYVMNEESG